MHGKRAPWAESVSSALRGIRELLMGNSNAQLNATMKHRGATATILLNSCGFHEANRSINRSSKGSGRCLETKLNKFWCMHRA